MYIFEQNNHNTSLDDWCKACSYQPPVGMVKLEEEDKIIILTTEELQQITQYLSGKIPIPDIEHSKDILGDIESFDVSIEEWEYGHGWNCSIDDINGLNMTNGYIGASNFTFKYPKFGVIEDSNGTYYTDRYPLRKGYPSFMMKKWES